MRNKTLSSLESLSTHLKKIEETLDLGAEQDDFVVASYFGHMIKSADLYEKILRLKTMVSLFGDDEIHEVFERLGLGQINEHNPYTCRGIVNALQSAVKKEPILSGSDYNDPIKLIDFYKKIDCYKITEESTVVDPYPDYFFNNLEATLNCSYDERKHFGCLNEKFEELVDTLGVEVSPNTDL